MLSAMKRVSLLYLAVVCALPASSAVRLPKVFSDHTVLQRNQPIHIWGWSDPGETVSVSLNGETQSAVGDRLGHWSVFLPQQAAGGPYQLKVNDIALNDIMLGDVWFASGQSNMEMPLKGFGPDTQVKNGAGEIRNANQPMLRLLLIPHKTASFPLEDFDGKVAWTPCTPETAANFSAAAYFFGREVADREHVTIGLVDSTWGGTPAAAWVSMDSLSADAALMPEFAVWARTVDEQADVPAMLAAERAEDEAAKRNNQPKPSHSWHPDSNSYDPSWLYNGMVAPMTKYGIAGVIWYQGETDSSLERNPYYHRVFSTLIEDWRHHWRQGEFPFLFTQISSFTSDSSELWPAVRQAQLETLSLVHTGMAVTIDVGNPDNVHPSDKQTVGRRLALAALAIAYREQIEYSGPLFKQAILTQGGIQVFFTHANGLTAHGSTLQGFEIAGRDEKWVPASATIQGDTVLVRADGVSDPMYVRYAWANAPQGVNLYNEAGLPASPFTSDPAEWSRM